MSFTYTKFEMPVVSPVPEMWPGSQNGWFEIFMGPSL